MERTWETTTSLIRQERTQLDGVQITVLPTSERKSVEERVSDSRSQKLLEGQWCSKVIETGREREEVLLDSTKNP